MLVAANRSEPGTSGEDGRDFAEDIGAAGIREGDNLAPDGSDLGFRPAAAREFAHDEGVERGFGERPIDEQSAEILIVSQEDGRLIEKWDQLGKGVTGFAGIGNVEKGVGQGTEGNRRGVSLTQDSIKVMGEQPHLPGRRAIH